MIPRECEGGQSLRAGRSSGMAVSGMYIGRLLSEDLILSGFVCPDKARLTEELVRRLCAARSLPGPEAFLRKILEREKGINTTLESGLSIPHARVSGISKVFAILAVLARPIPDPMQNQYPVRAMLLFLAPDSEEYSKLYLHLLREVSIVFQSECIDELSRAASAAQALDLIRKREPAA